MELESLGSYFTSGSKDLLRRTRLAFQLEERLRQMVKADCRVILRKQTIVIRCPDQATAAAVELRKRRVLALITEIFGGPIEEKALKIRVE